MHRLLTFVTLLLFLTACTPATAPSASVQVPEVQALNSLVPSGFVAADGSRPLSFPQDFGAHEDFRTEWWYYTGNLQTPDGRPFGFELTIFRVGLLPPTAEVPSTSKWYGRSIYFAHFALSDIQAGQFHAYERYSRPGPGLSGAQADPYRVWLEDWNITERKPGTYRLQAEQEGIRLDLTLNDEMGVVLHGDNGYSLKGKSPDNASYYFSQPRLQAEGSVQVNGTPYPVSGLAWMDHEFSTSALDPDQVGWDWFSLQFEEGPALMLYQLRQQDGNLSDAFQRYFREWRGKAAPIKAFRFQDLCERRVAQSTHPGSLSRGLGDPAQPTRLPAAGPPDDGRPGGPLPGSHLLGRRRTVRGNL